ncbi:hypothetical protein GQ600_27595 [Phytophthora cactorum]|nr:hypothetical protein GQ600_27595 [Phytophthora cactorum]
MATTPRRQHQARCGCNFLAYAMVWKQRNTVYVAMAPICTIGLMRPSMATPMPNTTRASGMDSRSFCTMRRQRCSTSRALRIFSSFSASGSMPYVCFGRPLASGRALSSGARPPASNVFLAWIMVTRRNLKYSTLVHTTYVCSTEEPICVRSLKPLVPDEDDSEVIRLSCLSKCCLFVPLCNSIVPLSVPSLSI